MPKAASKASRNPSRRVADVAPDLLAALHAGTRETSNLVEALAIDPVALLTQCLPPLGLAPLLDDLLPQLQSSPRPKVMASSRLIGRALQPLVSVSAGARSRWGRVRGHASDTIRGWAALAIGDHDQLTLAEKLVELRPLAADPHFGVREMAWLGLRDSLLRELEAALDLLQPWTCEPDENLRRFASEATRPRGVWCAHSLVLKATPELGLPLLEPLRSDPSKYVRLSVGNWLNDASKSHPEWVRQVCTRWERESPTTATQEILRKALRTIGR